MVSLLVRYTSKFKSNRETSSNVGLPGKKPGTKMLLAFGKRYRMLFWITSIIVFEKTDFFAEECFNFFTFHICLPTVTSISTWPKNDMDRTCIYSNGLSRSVKNCCSVASFFGIFYGRYGIRIFHKYFREYMSLTVVESFFFCRFSQYMPRPFMWAIKVGPMCKCDFCRN